MSEKSPAEKSPAALEASNAETVSVEYEGESYTFPAALDEASGDVLDAIDDMKLSYALKALMSTEDWKRFKATKPRVKAYGQLFDAYAKEIGLDTTGG